MHTSTEGKILKVLSNESLNPDELANRISTSTEEVREAVLDLLDKGRVALTLDWRLKLRSG